MFPRGKVLQSFKDWLKTVNRDQRWCIVIIADPDAMASAAALKRIMASRTKVDIYRTNEISRPDNLAMMRYLHLEIPRWKPELQAQYTHFAIVDGQPHHSRDLAGIPFSVVIDHHPLVDKSPVVPPRTDAPKTDAREGTGKSAGQDADNADGTPRPFAPQYVDIRPQIGATCTILCEYLHGLGIRPSPTLATAMTLGIRTDTALFERGGGKSDFDAYQWLSSRSNDILLRRIVRSEYLLSWLPLFARAFRNLLACRGTGSHAWVGEVENADLLVAIADFFTRVHGLKWIAVSGLVQKKTVVVIFRGDGSRDIGRLADACFHDVGSAGGHRTLARAEFPAEAVPREESCLEFIQNRLQKRKLRPRRTTG